MALAALVAAIACGQDGDGGSSGRLAEDQTLRVALGAEPDYIDPSLAAFPEEAMVAKNIFATLLRFDPTVNELYPYVAVEVPNRENGGISGDGLTYTFKLRASCARMPSGRTGGRSRPRTSSTASSGSWTPVLAPTTANTYYTTIVEGGAELSQAVDADEGTIESLRQALAVRALDDHTLQVTLIQPTPTFNLQMSLWPTAALRQDVIESHGDIANTVWTEAGNLVASGPFRLAAWDHGERIVLERIVFSIIQDENTAYVAYQSGGLDMAPVPLASLRGLSDDPELRRVAQATTVAIVFNQTHPPFDTLNARESVCQAIDRETLVNEVQQGLGNPTTAWLPPGLLPYYDAERGQGLVFDPDSVQVSGSDPKPPADFTSSVELTYFNTDPNPTRAEFLQGQWKQNLGLSVDLEPLDGAAFFEAFFGGDYDLTFIGFTQDYHHPQNWLLLWTEDGALNTGGYSNPEYDAAVESALAADDPQEAVRLWQRAEGVLIDEDVALCALFNDETAWLVKPYVQDLLMTGADGIPGDFFCWQTAIIER